MHGGGNNRGRGGCNNRGRGGGNNRDNNHLKNIKWTTKEDSDDDKYLTKDNDKHVSWKHVRKCCQRILVLVPVGNQTKYKTMVKKLSKYTKTEIEIALGSLENDKIIYKQMFNSKYIERIA